MIKSTKADIIVLTEVGNKHDVAILKDELTKIHMNYRYSTVGKSSPRDQTKQHVAILSVYKLNNITKQLPGREGYLEEPDDPDSENDTGVSKSVRAEVSVDMINHSLYPVYTYPPSAVGMKKINSALPRHPSYAGIC